MRLPRPAAAIAFSVVRQRPANYVFRIGQDKRGLLFNSITGRLFPEADAEKYLALPHQRQAAIDSLLFTKPSWLNIVPVTAPGCNMRCSHCWLPDAPQAAWKKPTSAASVSDFVNRYLDEFSVSHVGSSLCLGEPLMDAEAAIRVSEAARCAASAKRVSYSLHVSTNLSLPMNAERLELLVLADALQVSVDGDEQAHNTRRSLPQHNPYADTMRNFRLLLQMGMADKLFVTSVPIPEFYADRERLRGFVRSLLLLGVHKQHIRFVTPRPSARLEADDAYRAYWQTPHYWVQPCCVWSWMSQACLWDDRVSASHFEPETSDLGPSAQDMALTAENFRQFIRQKMPVLQDPGCADCPVIGVCWGRCANSCYHHQGLPSRCCPRDALIESVMRDAREGRLPSIVCDTRAAGRLPSHR